MEQFKLPKTLMKEKEKEDTNKLISYYTLQNLENKAQKKEEEQEGTIVSDENDESYTGKSESDEVKKQTRWNNESILENFLQMFPNEKKEHYNTCCSISGNRNRWYLVCKVCQVKKRCDLTTSLASHVNGKKHKENVKTADPSQFLNFEIQKLPLKQEKHVLSKDFILKQVLQTDQAGTSNDYDIYKSSSGSWIVHCKICDQALEWHGTVIFKRHIDSKKHLKNVVKVNHRKNNNNNNNNEEEEQVIQEQDDEDEESLPVRKRERSEESSVLSLETYKKPQTLSDRITMLIQHKVEEAVLQSLQKYDVQSVADKYVQDKIDSKVKKSVDDAFHEQ